MHAWTVTTLGALLLITAACGGDGDNGTTTGTTTTGDTTGTNTSSIDPTTGPASSTSDSDSQTGSTTTPSSTSTSEPPPDTSTTEPPPATSTTDTSADTTTDTTDTTADTTGNTTDVVDCTDLGPNQCAAQPGCQEVLGQKINAQKMCLQKPSFLACIAADGCDDAPTIACPMGTNQQYQFPDTCIPPDFEVCDGMTLDMNCV